MSAAIPPRVDYLIHRFFQISDNKDPESGVQFANEIFTKDGVFQTHETLKMSGYDEIAGARAKLHPATDTRTHNISDIYISSTSPSTDFVVLGQFHIGLKDGNTTSMDFTARFVIKEEEGEQKVGLVRVWTDPKNMLEAFAKAAETLGLDVE